MSLMKAFRHKITGKTAMYPDTPFWRNHPHFELVDESGDCEDCPKLHLNNEALVVVPTTQEEEAGNE